MTSAAQFRTVYESALARHLAERDESGLRAAYELGRDAIAHGLGVLDLAAVHHEALVAALPGVASSSEIERVARAAGDFFLESLSAFEMIQRGFSEAREAALLERRHAEMVRQLSNLLADASLALGASDSLEEMLQLVAEEARELTNARYCLATADVPAADRVIRAASFADAADARWSELLESGRPSREAARVLPSFLWAPLTTLDEREFGSIQLVNKADGEFTELDEAVVVHLAQMAAAALERARLYERR
jgi:hypothetical protein